jgi:hypothetical protein
VDVDTIFTSMASLIRKARSRIWFACFRDASGRQSRNLTKTSDQAWPKTLFQPSRPDCQPFRARQAGLFFIETQKHFYLDDLLPKLFGKPLLGD